MDVRTHWEEVHAESAADEVSWFQSEPRLSLELLDAAGMGPDARVLDVGCGAAGLPAHLLAKGVRGVAALDVSENAIRRAQEQMGPDAARVTWLHADVLELDAARPFDVWHDRAVFHFLTDPQDQARYVRAVERNLRPRGHVVLATFAPDGPEQCSGLPVARHDAASLQRALGEAFEMLRSQREEHATPWGATQAFTWALFRRR